MKPYLLSLTLGFFSLNVLGQHNTSYGEYAIGNASGHDLTAFGWRPFYFSGTGSYNTAIGTAAMFNTPDGSYNTGLGAYVMFNSNSTASNNTAAGAYSLYTNINGVSNTTTGSYSMYKNSSGHYNTANGYQALYSNTSTSYLTGVGYRALYSNTSGTANTAIGSNALVLNTTGSNNVASGTDALRNNKSGSFNTSIGAKALNSNNGWYNTAVGYNVLAANSSGYYNTGIGTRSLEQNSSGVANTSIGYMALSKNTTASYNVAVGYYALSANNGGKNVAIGYLSLYTNTTGNSNISIGYSAMQKNTTGFNNVAVGEQSLYNNITGGRNTAIGDSSAASFAVTYGTFLGYKTDATVANLTNVTAVGHRASVTASNQVRIGNTSVTSIGGKVGWSTISDGRFKDDVQADIPGLELINKLTPVSYILNKERINTALKVQSTEENNRQSSRQSGFIAQDVEKAAKELGFEFSAVDAPQNDGDLYGLRYAEFVVPLVRAVQQLDSVNKAKDERIALLEEKLNEVLELFGQDVISSSAWIKQNSPNPIIASTTIQYFIPNNIRAARILITNAKGQQIQVFNVSGSGSVNFSAGTLPSGIYTYTLVADGKSLNSKKMVIAR